MNKDMKKVFSNKLEGLGINEKQEFTRPDALREEFTGQQKTGTMNMPVVKVIETDIYPINHYFG